MSASPPVTALRGVGDALAERLRALGVENTQDLLFLLPLRYEDRTHIVPLGELRPGQRAAIEAEIPERFYYSDVHGSPSWRRHMTLQLAEEIRAELAGTAKP